MRRTSRPSRRSAGTTRRTGSRLFRVDLRNLVALYAEPCHQALLAKDECVDVVLGCRRSHRLGLALVNDDHGGTDADLEAVGGVELRHCTRVDEKHRIAELLRT